MKVSQTSWSTMWTFESSDFVDTYLQRGLCHTSFISDLKLITISFQVHVYHHKTLFNLGSLLGGSRPVSLAGVSMFAPLKWTFFRDLCRWRVSNLTCSDSFHSFISVEVSLSYKLLTNSVILYTNRARTNDSPSQRAKTTWLRELHQCSYVTNLGFIWQLLTFEENESFAGFIKYRNTTLLEPFENVVDF